MANYISKLKWAWDEIEDYMVQHYMNEQDHDDLVRENAELQRQHEEMVADDVARATELEELRQALKRKLHEREVWIQIKRLRVSVEQAYEAMGIAVPLVEEGVAIGPSGDRGATGSDGPTAAEVVAAVDNFEEATAEARRCLDDLNIHQQHMD